MSPLRGEIWIAELGYAEKTRPVIVVSKNDPNPPRAIITYVPITSEHRGSAYEVDLSAIEFLNKGSIANAQAVGTASKHVFKFKKGDVPADLMKRIESALLERLGIAPQNPRQLKGENSLA